MKHRKEVSNDSLKAFFISNSKYLKSYKKIIGLTGTIGSQAE